MLWAVHVNEAGLTHRAVFYGVSRRWKYKRVGGGVGWGGVDLSVGSWGI